MAATREAQRLTESHRLSQARLGARVAGQILATWNLLDIDDLDGSFDRWLRAVMPLVEAQHGASSRLAVNYLDLFKKLELGAGARTPVVLAEMSREALTTSLLVTGPVTVKSNLSNGALLDQAVDAARTKVAGTALRHALEGGRSTITNTIAADQQALGYSRATSGQPCSFCAMLASRGPVYKGQDTAGFRAHDHCSCSTEPVYRRDAAWPAGSERYRELWDQAQREAAESGELRRGTENDSLNAFRRLLAN